MKEQFTFDKINEFLKNRFHWEQKSITLYLFRYPIKSFKNNYDHINIYLCFYHFITFATIEIF